MNTGTMIRSPGCHERGLCARFARPSLGRALWQLANTLPAFALLWLLMACSLRAHWGHGTGCVGIRHLYEAEAAWATGVAIGDQGDLLDGSMRGKQRANGLIGGGEGKISDI